MKKLTALIACFTLILQLFTACLPMAALAEGGSVLYVSTDGNDDWSGTKDKPLKTLEAARALISREHLKNATVYFRGGTYVFDRTLGFSAADNNVTFSACPGETVVFSGAYTIDNWQTEYVNGKAVWTADVDASRIGGALNTLYGRDGLLPNARLPETGYYYAAGSADERKAILYRGEELSGLSEPTNIRARLFHYWVDEYLPVTGIDEAGRKVAIDRASAFAAADGDAYYLENVREALDRPGEWYMDYAAGKLYYMPCENETIDSTEVRAGGLEKLMDISGCSGLSFHGITFADTNWTDNGSSGGQADNNEKPCIEIRGSDNVRFTGCRFENIGESCLRITDGSSFCTVSGCEFKNIGAHAVYISGPNSESGLTHDITVTDNHIYNYGLMRPMAVAVFQTYARNSVISHNEIHHGAYSAVSLGWTWGYGSTVNNHNTVSDNLIYDIGHAALSDLGGIYLLGVADGTVVSGNVVFDVAAGPDASTYGGWGIYLDEGSQGVTVENNLVYDCDSQGFHQHYGQENAVRNNIFAMNHDAQVRSSRSTTAEELGGASPAPELYLTNNILVGDGQLMYQWAAKNRFADNKNLYFDYLYGVSGNDEVYADTGDNSTLKGRAEMQALGYYKNAVFADPGFTDPENRNFTFADTAAAEQIGFVPYDYFANKVGSVTYGSRYLLNTLSREKSSYEPEQWAEYQLAKRSAVSGRSAQTISALENAYNALRGSQAVSAEPVTVTNTADWLLSGQVRQTVLSKWKTVTYAQAKTSFFVSGVSGGTDLADPAGSALAAAYPIESVNTAVDVDMRSKTEAASAILYVDRSLYEDLSETELRFGVSFESAAGQGIRTYAALMPAGDTAPRCSPAESITVGSKTYSVTHGLRATPLAGKPDGYDTAADPLYFGKATSGRLYGPAPDKGETVSLRLAGIELVRRTADCELKKQDPASYYYYCVNSYIDLTLVGVDKGALRSAYRAALALGKTGAAVDNALAVLNSVSAPQAEIDAALYALAAQTDKTALKAALDLALAYTSAEYTAATWKPYAAALENGRAVFADPFASQAEIDAAAVSIANAYNGLTDCRKLIEKCSTLTSLHPADFSQYALYEFGSALDELRAGLISSTPAGQEQLIAEFDGKYASLLSHPAENATVQVKLSQHKYNNALTRSVFYVEGVAGGESADVSFDFDTGGYDELRCEDRFNLTVASKAVSAKAVLYVDRSILRDLSETALRVGVDLPYVTAGSMRVYLMFADGFSPVYENRDSVTVDGKTYTLGIGTYDNPVIGGPNGSNTVINTTPMENVKGRAGVIYGPVPEAGEEVTLRLAACIFNQNFGRTAYYCGNSFIDLTVCGVDKAQLRALALGTCKDAPNGCDTASPEYAEYRAALSEALAVTYGDTYAQDAVDAAAERLQSAYDALGTGTPDTPDTPDEPDEPDTPEQPVILTWLTAIVNAVRSVVRSIFNFFR